MITINYIKQIYIRFIYNSNDVIKPDSYSIDACHNDNMVIYHTDEFSIEIARFKELIDAVEYVKWLCDG